MLKKYKGTLLLSSIVILLPILAGVLLWENLPAEIPTHWNIHGEVDGYSSKAFSVVGLPLILTGMQWLCVWLSDTLSGKQEQNGKIMALVLWILPAVSLLMGGATYTAAMGLDLRMEQICFAFMGLLLMAIGNYLPKCTQNRVVGVRIKWTLESEENWNATHRFAGRLWAAAGLVVLVLGFLPFVWAKAAGLTILFVAIFLPVFYSYRYHKTHA